MSAQRSVTLARWVRTCHPIAIIVCAGLYVTLPQMAGDILFCACALFPAVAVVVGIRVNRIHKPVHMHLLLVSLLLMAVPSIAWIVQVDIQGHPATNPAFYLIAALGYPCSLAASAVIVARHAPHDPGGVVHAALLGLGLAGLPWTLMIRPSMVASSTGLTMQVVVIVVLMSLMTIMGSLMRLTSTAVRARAPLYYLFTAQSTSVVATAMANMNLDANGAHPRWVDTMWFVAYFSLAATVLHPAVGQLTTPYGAYPDDMSARGLIGTGLLLSINPTLAIGGIFFGQTPDVLLMSISVLISVPLLLFRFWSLNAQRLKAERALAHQAAHDELTGLPNRRTLMDRVDGALLELHNGSLDSLAILFFDLDGFKPINDSLGHQAGDQVLQIVGRRLQLCVRGTDVVGRLGGDEFLVMCAGMKGRSVEDTVNRLRASISEPIAIDGNTCTVGASIGVAVAEGSIPVTAAALIAEADQAMYAIKNARRGTRRAA